MRLLWSPSNNVVENANITKFKQYINKKHKLNLTDYNDIYQYSISKIEDFWRDVAEFTGIIFSKKPERILSSQNEFPPNINWFQGAELNFAQNLLKHNNNNIAILSKREVDAVKQITYSELRDKVARVSNGLRENGIKVGDRIAAYMPNISETVICMLAASSVGAIFSSCGAELGASAALDRLGQVEPKIVFSVDSYTYKEKKFSMEDKLKTVVSGISSIEKLVILNYVDQANIENIPRTVGYDEFQSDNLELTFEQLPFEHPLFIMFSSGTTGKPKCMVQSAGGVLLNHLKELVLHTDMKEFDKLFYISSPSWMMWNWMTSSLAIGSVLVLFDGNPLYPDWKMIWKFIEEYGITIFGCSASYLHYLNSIKAEPNDFGLDALREISQTGSALSDEGFDFVYSKIKSDLHFNSISGGTDINGCFAAGVPILPVYSGQLQARALGMNVAAYDLDGKEIFDKQGELVCITPSPSMPIYFWKDEGNVRYTNAYFTYYTEPKVWRHGDYIKIISETGGVSFYGRSDSVLKPSGVRIGTSELYNIVESFDEISDSLAIGQQYNNDQRIILFVMLAKNIELNEELKKKIVSELRSKASPRHVPALIIETPDIPYTFSGKKVESAITNIIHNRKIVNQGAMRNPECLEFYEKIREELTK